MGLPEQATVIKRDHRGQEKWRYRGVVLDRTPGRVILEAIYDGPDEEFHGIRLRKGDRFVEAHFADRWYNVFAMYDRESGRLKGWYCNITRPARIDGGQISAEDLALDLIVRPDGSWVVVDEAEFEAQELLPADRTKALAGLAELKELAQSLQGPFQQS